MEKIAPTVTVVIPVYNGANYLEEAIRSVLVQTYRDFEIVVIDDGSTDGTWPIIERFTRTHPELVRGIRKENGGVATALNAGIQAARGKYFAWLSHDDRWVSSKLEKQLHRLQSYPEAVGVYSDYSYIDAQGNCIGRVYAPWYPQAEMLRHFLQFVFINGSTLLIERRCLLEAGLFDETLRYAQDALMWVHLMVRYPLVHISEALTEYRVHPEQTTTSVKRAALRKDNGAWLRRAVNDYTVQQIFPELNKPNVTSAELIKAYLYLGNVMIMQHLQFGTGIEQFVKAWHTWPSFRNPVLLQAPRAFLYACYRYLRTRRRDPRFGKASQDQQNGLQIVDLRSWSEPVKGHSFLSVD